MKIYIMLVEGLIDRIAYSAVAERLGAARCPEGLAAALGGELPRKRSCYAVGGGLVLIVEAGGYSALQAALRELLRRAGEPDSGLARLAREHEVHVVIVADRDVEPLQGMGGLLASLGLSPAAVGGAWELEVGGGGRIRLRVLEQGVPGGTGQIEDELQAAVAAARPDVAARARCLGELTPKQKLLVYLALLGERPKVRQLAGELAEVLKAADEAALGPLIERLKAALSP